MPEREQQSRQRPDRFAAGILSTKYPDLHVSKEVVFNVETARTRGASIANDPREEIAHYLGFVSDRHGLMGGNELRRSRQVARRVMAPKDVPEAYFANQQRIAREQGHGDIEITPEMRRQLTEAVVADQTKSLETWVDYVNHPDAAYPAWFRYYTLRSVLQTGPYNKEKHAFSKRNRGTTAPYPDLNREALAYVYDGLSKQLQGAKPEDLGDEKLAALLQAPNFGKLYVHAVENVTPATTEQREQTAGEWIKYDQSDGAEGIMRSHLLSQSLLGHGTGWCTAGESTAKMQLAGGDFYVYSTYDQDGKPTVPRVAIRMEDGHVAEVRGINADQNLEPELLHVAETQLATLPGGSEYQQKAADMKELTAIETKHKTGTQLNLDELRFVYEVDRPILGFGYQKDPRIEEILSTRDKRTEAALLYECTPEQIALNNRELHDETRVLFGKLDAKLLPEGRLPVQLQVVRGPAYFDFSQQVTDLGELKRIEGNADFGFSQVTDLGQLEHIGGGADFWGSQVKELGKLTTIGGEAYFRGSQVTSLGELERIGGGANFNGSQVTDLGELKSIGEEAYFAGSQVTNLGELEHIGGGAYIDQGSPLDSGRLKAITKGGTIVRTAK